MQSHFRSFPGLYSPLVGATTQPDTPGPNTVLRWSAAAHPPPDLEPTAPLPVTAAAAPEIWAAAVMTIIYDTLAGRRDLSLLRRWISSALYRRLEARVRTVPLAAGLSLPARVRTVHVSEPTPGVYECSVVVADSGRVRAAAVRIEAFRGRWRITALELG